MDATKLKYIAAAAMLIDHGAALLLAPGPLQFLLRGLGRIAFPIFAYLLAESLRKGGDPRRLLARLGIFSILSEGPFLLAFGDDGFVCSVMATFFLATGAVILFERLREASPLPTALLPTLAACLLAQVFHCDYGAAGVLLVVGVYLFLESGLPRSALRLLALWCVLLYLLCTPLPGLLMRLPAGIYTPGLGDIVAGYLPSALLLGGFYTLCALASILFLWRYNGARGVGRKWFFYVFYPAHLLLLYGISLLCWNRAETKWADFPLR